MLPSSGTANMAATQTAGNSRSKTFVAPLDSGTHTWELEGLTSAHFAAAKAGNEIYSPEFDACGHKWKLKACLNGTTGYAVFVGLLLVSADAIVHADYTLQISGRDAGPLWFNSIFCTRQPAVDGSGSTNRSNPLLSHSDIAASPNKYLPGGMMTITATITLKHIRVAADSSPLSSITVPPPSVMNELRALLDSGVGADVALACGGQSVPAHSLVLRMRSPVFRAQLAPDSPLVAAVLSAVPVPEEITPATLRRLLEFIYSDELEPASPEEAGALLAASRVPASPGSF